MGGPDSRCEAASGKGTTIGTITDVNGNYSITVPSNATALVFTFIGMKPQEIPISGRSVIDSVLESDLIGLNEIVVTALGISARKSVGTCGTGCKKDVPERTLVIPISQALCRSHIDIKPSSGMPGASSQIIIRGSRSFTGNNTPLYVVDGMPIASASDFSTGNSVTEQMFLTVQWISTLLILESINIL